MAKRMTMVFDDEDLYRDLRVEAARTGCHAKDIVSQAVRAWLEAREGEALRAELAEARAEWERHGGVEAGAFFREIESGATG
ncbi:MAG: hypothetical protein HYY05_00985 [Chloroflexi bacterium]|nr:hypothetical protein [Chloroflexota bacterium]